MKWGKNSIYPYSYLFFLLFFVLREREWERARERGRQRIPSRLHAISMEPDAGLSFTHHEIITSAKFMSRTLNQLGHPGAPTCFMWSSYLCINPDFHLVSFPSAWRTSFKVSYNSRLLVMNFLWFLRSKNIFASF